MISKWSELPIGILEQIRVADKEYQDEDTKIMTIAGILAGYTYKEMMDLPLSETKKLIANTAFLYTEPKKKKMQKSYMLNGTTYIPLRKVEDMTTAQFIDYQAISRDTFTRVSEFLAIFLVPEGYKYNSGYDRDKVIDDISTYLTAEEGLGMADFFIRRCVRLIRRTLLLTETKVAMLKMRKGSKETREIVEKAEKEIQNLRRMYGYRWLKR